MRPDIRRINGHLRKVPLCAQCFKDAGGDLVDHRPYGRYAALFLANLAIMVGLYVRTGNELVWLFFLGIPIGLGYLVWERRKLSEDFYEGV